MSEKAKVIVFDEWKQRMNYMNCHAHTMYSNLRLLDCINHVENLMDTAAEMGMSGIAITDHECLSAHIRAIHHLEKVHEKYPDFTLALGNEIYLIDERAASGQQYYHFILIALDAIGHKGLRELSSKAWLNAYVDRRKRVPTTKQELADLMKKYKGHIAATTACLGGELSANIMAMHHSAAQLDDNSIVLAKRKITNFIEYCKETFGDDFYIECAPSSASPQKEVNADLMRIADSFQVKLIPGTDAHFLTERDRPMHKAFLTSDSSDSKREREVDEFYEFARLMTPQECVKLLGDGLGEDKACEILYNSLELQNKVTHYSLAKTQYIPQVQVLDYPTLQLNGLCANYPTLVSLAQSDIGQERYWVNECLTQLKEYDLLNEIYLERLEIEADVVRFIGDKLNTCMFAYFNTFKHYIDMFWDCGSIVGPGRGSATGFLSNYLLGITQLDPIRWNLPYWRFLNKERAELPDIDIDLAPSKRPAIFARMREERGGLLTLSQIATFGTVGARKAILTACRGYRTKAYPNGIDVDVAQYMSSLVPTHRGFTWSLHDMVHGNPEEDRKPIRAFINEVNQYPGLLDIMLAVQGLVAEYSSHASGVILYDGDPYETMSFMTTPGGDIITYLDLHDSEECGNTKYDFLVTAVTDKFIKCFELLKTDNLIEHHYTLRQLYNKYLHPEQIDTTNQLLWDHLAACDVLEVFQFNEGSGSAIAKKMQPQNPLEMTAANAMMRLMSEKGKESQQDRYVRIKREGIESFEEELIKVGFDDNERKLIHHHCDTYYGCCALQEQMMEMLMDIAHFSLGEANNARKIVGKKLMEKIPELEGQVFSKFSDIKKATYFWDLAVRPQLGYAFSLNHSLPYSFVGLQTLELAVRFNHIYWSTSCLIVNSGGMDDDERTKESSTDYSKVAKAIGDIKAAGITVSLADINRSCNEFVADAENNQILFGLKGMLNVGDEVIQNIIINRPYESFNDFLNKVKPKKPVVISLIKGGAFDGMYDRKFIMAYYLWLVCEKKKRITLQNMRFLIQYNLIPDNLLPQVKVYEFTRRLKEKFKKYSNAYVLDDRSLNYIHSNYPFTPLNSQGDEALLEIKQWTSIYEGEMDKVRAWMQECQEDVLRGVNSIVFKEAWDKYAQGSYSAWEMEVLCCYYHDHELTEVNMQQYGIVDFYDLPEEPLYDYSKSFTNQAGRRINLYKLTRIAGTCLAKNKDKGLVTLLTTTGVVTVKFRKEHFSMFDKAISRPRPDGTKQTLETSWFNRGEMIVVTGMRREDIFIAKKYKSTGGHHLYKIKEVQGSEIITTHERVAGVAVEEEETVYVAS